MFIGIRVGSITYLHPTILMEKIKIYYYMICHSHTSGNVTINVFKRNSKLTLPGFLIDLEPTPNKTKPCRPVPIN